MIHVINESIGLIYRRHARDFRVFSFHENKTYSNHFANSKEYINELEDS